MHIVAFSCPRITWRRPLVQRRQVVMRQPVRCRYPLLSRALAANRRYSPCLRYPTYQPLTAGPQEALTMNSVFSGGSITMASLFGGAAAEWRGRTGNSFNKGMIYKGNQVGRARYHVVIASDVAVPGHR